MYCLCNLEGGKRNVALCENAVENLDRRGKHGFEEGSKESRKEKMTAIRSLRYGDVSPSSLA